MKTLADKTIGCKHCLGQWLPAQEVFKHIDRVKDSVESELEIAKKHKPNQTTETAIRFMTMFLIQIKKHFGELK